MKTYLVAFFMSAVVTVVFTPLVMRFAPRLGAVDLPSGRRVNKKVIPRLGGLAILLGFFAPLIGLLFWDNKISALFTDDFMLAVALFGGAIVMAGLGAIDDLKGCRAWIKLLIQIAVAAGAYAAGYRIDTVSLPFIGELQMGVFGAPITVLWIVGIVNAINLVDGLDGLAAGVSFFVCVVAFVVGVIEEYRIASLFSCALGGALIGFLFFNFNPAKIFMGDSGSMFVGYVLATISLMGSKGSTAVALLVPVLALGLPIMDTLLTIVRRVLEKRPIFSPDKGHIHHRLLDMGLTHRRAVLLLYGITVLFTVIALVVYVGRTWQVGVTLLVASVLALGLTRAAGLFQKSAIRRSQRKGEYTEDVQRQREAAGRFLTGVGAAGVDRKMLLNDFAGRAGLALIDCRESHIPSLSKWYWEIESHGNGNTRGYISATFQVNVDGPAPGKIKFGWFSESHEVSPQSEILLRLVADEMAGTFDGSSVEVGSLE